MSDTNDRLRAMDVRIARELFKLRVFDEWPLRYDGAARHLVDGELLPDGTFTVRIRNSDAVGPVYLASIMTDTPPTWPPTRDPGQTKWFVWVEPVPSYSTDLDAAWSIIDRLREDWNQAIRISVIVQPMHAYECDIVALTGHGRIGRAFAATAPEAIVAAALASIDRFEKPR